MAEKTYMDELELLKTHQKKMYKTFKEKQTGHIYQLVMFSLEWATGSLTATMALCSHSAYKRTIPMAAFNAVFEKYDPHEERKERENAATI